jgi:hypothetical protein
MPFLMHAPYQGCSDESKWSGDLTRLSSELQRVAEDSVAANRLLARLPLKVPPNQ